MSSETFKSLPAVLWLPAVIAASILYRRSVGKPILFFTVASADFLERTASGCSNDTWWRKIGGASGCLVVAVTSGRLVIRPWFPFNLMFLPEILGLEHDVPLSNIVSASLSRMFFRRRVRLVLRDTFGANRDVSLFLKQPEEFLRLVMPSAQPGMPPDAALEQGRHR